MGKILDNLAHYAGKRNATVWARQDAPRTTFLGRNGRGASAGLIMLHGGHDERGRAVVALAPITGRGEIGKCEIEVPLVDLVDLVDRMRGDECPRPSAGCKEHDLSTAGRAAG